MTPIAQQAIEINAEIDRINAEYRANKLAIGEAQVSGDRKAEKAAWQRDDDLLDELSRASKALAALLPQMTDEDKAAVKAARSR